MRGLNNFVYYQKKGKVNKTWVLLHGTGADEYDLVPLAQSLRDDFGIVSLRGNVSEGGMIRFFERKAMGEFVEESVRQEAKKLAEFIKAFGEENKVGVEELIYLGYSNGANMILALLMTVPELVAEAVLLHPMLPLEERRLELEAKRFFVSYGEADQMISAQESEKVIRFLKKYRGKVDKVAHSGGHEIRPEELVGVKEFVRPNDKMRG